MFAHDSAKFLPSVMNQQLYTMDVELLIMKVKKNSAIYDASDKNHRNRHFIAAAWKSISDDLNISGKFIHILFILNSNYT